MQNLKFFIDIEASKEKVWSTLWQDETLRQWASIIDPGTYMVGNLEEGQELQFISASGYGVTSLVEKLITNEFLLLRHSADTQDSGRQERQNEWTGGQESYALVQKGNTTTLTATFDVPPELKDYFEINYPKALKKLKELAER